MQCSISRELSLKTMEEGCLRFSIDQCTICKQNQPFWKQMDVADGCNVDVDFCFVKKKKCKLIFIIEKKLDVCLNKVLSYVNLLP